MTRDDVVLAMRGDRLAFGRLVTATAPTVAGIAFAVTGDREAARDVAQDTYLAAWKAIGRLRSPDSFLPWLRQIARLIARSELRTRYRRANREHSGSELEELLASVPSRAADPEAAAIALEERALLADALEVLPDEVRECVVLFYSEGQSVDQVASLLGLSSGAVRKRLERARKRLNADLLDRLGRETRRLGMSIPPLVAVDLANESVPRGAAATAIASATLAAVPAAGFGGAAIGLLGSVMSVRSIAGHFATVHDRGRFAMFALIASAALGFVAPLVYPGALWIWFLVYQLLVAWAMFWWLPRHGVLVRKRDIARWLLLTAVGTVAVWWASTRIASA